MVHGLFSLAPQAACMLHCAQHKFCGKLPVRRMEIVCRLTAQHELRVAARQKFLPQSRKEWII